MLQTHKWADRKMKLNTYWQTKGSKKEAKCINLLLEINLYEKISGYKFWLIIITYNQCTSYERKDFTIVSIFQPFFAITSSSRHYCIVVFSFCNQQHCIAIKSHWYKYFLSLHIHILQIINFILINYESFFYLCQTFVW